jgi:hypothetical protein
LLGLGAVRYLDLATTTDLAVLREVARNARADRDVIAKVCARHGLQTEWDDLHRM